MELEKKARLVFKFFGEDKQQLKYLEEYHELREALHGMAALNIKLKLDYEIHESKINDAKIKCIEEFSDNVFLIMQIEKIGFERAYKWLSKTAYTNKILEDEYSLENFTFDKGEVRRICCEKASRTLKRYNIKVEG